MSRILIGCERCGSTERGARDRCLECARRYSRQWRKDHPGIVRQQKKRWEAKNRVRLNAKSLAYMKAHPERRNMWRDKTPGMTKAHHAVAKAIRDGILIRPDACESCNKACKPQAAHYNYAELLKVRWLCRSCHSVWDRAESKSKLACV